jgi:hypothetical protein
VVNTVALLSQTISNTFPADIVFETIVTGTMAFTSVNYFGAATFSTPLSVSQTSTSTNGTLTAQVWNLSIYPNQGVFILMEFILLLSF